MTATDDGFRRRLAASLPIEADDPGLYWAAVAIVLVPDPDALLLIRRAHRDGDPWSGHMALPGGRAEPADADLAATAIRETAEEVGIPLLAEHLLGALSDVAPRTPTLPRIAVRPFVFRLPGRPMLKLNPEVAAAEWVELGLLMNPEIRQEVTVQVAGGSRRFPAFVTPHGVVWGLTERILTRLLSNISPR